MKKLLLAASLLLPFITHAQSLGGYVTTGIGVDTRQQKGDSTSARLGHGGAAQVQIGKRYENFDISLFGDFNGGKISNLSQTFNGTPTHGDYHYAAYTVGPQFRFFFGESSGKYEWSVFTGPVYGFINYEGRSFVDSTTMQEEDIEIERRGFGGLLGVGLSQKLESKYVDRIQYQISYKQLHYDRVDATYENAGRASSLKGKLNDKYIDRSIVLSVGLTFGGDNFGNFWDKAKNVAAAF